VRRFAMRPVHAVLSLLFLTVVGCRDATAPEERLVLEAVVSPSQVAPGTPFTVTIGVSNPTEYEISVTSPTSCHLAFEVIDTHDRRVSQGTTMGCRMAYTTLVLGSGETWDVTLNWSAVSDDAVPLPPGVYRVRGILVLAERSGRRSPPAQVVVSSP
jgi:hypothetical protein